jgi:hypothetical protein
MVWVLVLACGGGKDGDGDGPSDSHSGYTTATDPKFERCVRRCARGSEGPGCDATAIESACETYCVDPPPLPPGCDPFFEDYEACVARVEDWTCEGSTTRVGDVVVPVPADGYECRLESDELETCDAYPDPGCVPTIGGTGATCTADATLCNAGGTTFSMNLLCDGVICSMLVDDGTGPVDTTLPRADQLCDELFEKQALGDDEAARFLLALSGVSPR